MDFEKIEELKKRISEKKDELTFAESLPDWQRQDLEDQIENLEEKLDEIMD